MAAEEGKGAQWSLRERYQQLISSLPLREGQVPTRCYKGIWYPEVHLPGFLAFVDDFEPRDTDVFLLSFPKSGTTWLKALAFAILNRKEYTPFAPHHPLLHMNPHDCVPMVDELFGQELDAYPSPRLLSSHAAYQLLPESLTTSCCKFIYICREPKDTFVSGWHFAKELQVRGGSGLGAFSTTFQDYCEGLWYFGSFWDHFLGYWRESLKRPSKILFFKYEDLVEDPHGNVRRIAEFLGCPFSREEEEDGFVEGIVRLCSFEKLSGVEVNRNGDRGPRDTHVNNSAYFRRGKIGDWKNLLTAEMADKLDGIIKEKLLGSGLTFGHIE